MGIISVEKADNLYWLGRYTERVYTTLEMFFPLFDDIIERPEGVYAQYCERLNIPNIYTSNLQFSKSYLADPANPDSIIANMVRAYDNAIVLRDELTTDVLSYVQLALDIFYQCIHSNAPLLEVQQVMDYLYAFWGCADDKIDDESCRNILKCGKYIERLDLYIRFNHVQADIEKQYNRLINRLKKTDLCYNEQVLVRLKEIIDKRTYWNTDYQEALNCLGELLS